METKRDPERTTDDGTDRSRDESDARNARILQYRNGEPVEGAPPTSLPWAFLGENQAGDPGRDLEEEERKVLVGDRAFDELLDCAEKAEEEGEATGDGEMRRRMFAIAVNRAVKKARALPDPDGEPRWLTQTLKRYRCRIYFHRHEGVLHVVACVPLYPHLEGAMNTS